ncbi:MAG: ATP-dependent DNA helicase RecG [Huintestinicola sp.]
MNINDKITALDGVAAKRAQLYEKLGIRTVGELIAHYPKDYLDFTQTVNIDEAPIGENAVICGVVTKKIPAARIRQGLILYKVIIEDDTDSLTVIIYNNRFAYEQLEIGGEYRLYGKVSGGFTRKEMNSPLILRGDEKCLLRPKYALTEGLTQAMLITNISQALKAMPEEFPDFLPDSIRHEYNLCTEGYAVQNIHFPKDMHSAELARRRLGFDELMIMQCGMLMLKNISREEAGCRMKLVNLNEFFGSLPFEPTNAQKRAAAEIAADLCRDVPMNRLVQGDVGSGKTAVAAAACWFAAKNGCQSALMAPTEILARQHYATLKGFLEPLGIRTGCLTGSMTAKEKREVKAALAAGEIRVIAGTHALIAESTEFESLGLVITDEQHRFGVNQRKIFAGKGHRPHKLVMSATPIPRTLALIIYGDLDISVINELPKGRQPVETYAVTGKLRSRALNFLKKELDAGRQGYIVCPMISENEDMGDDSASVQAAEEYCRRVSENELQGYKVGLLHGKMPPAEKDAVMTDFKEGRLDVLVSTTVIEVGVDVPNATVIMIESSDRFGLSQLHQLRGRVGRGQYRSTCILLTDNATEDTRARLKIMSSTTDGFVIAEEDLKIRGAGDFFGDRQSGLPPLKIADLYNDRELLADTQHAAKELISKSPDLSMFPMLKERAEALLSHNGADGMN